RRPGSRRVDEHEVRPAVVAERVAELDGVLRPSHLRAERLAVALELGRGTDAIRVGADEEDAAAGAPRLRRELGDGRRLAVARRTEEEPHARRGGRRRGPERPGERRVEPRAGREPLGGPAPERRRDAAVPAPRDGGAGPAAGA